MSIPSSAPPLRPELLAAMEAMDATKEDFAYAVCRTFDDFAWEVCTKERNIYSSLEATHQSKEEAIAAGAVWLKSKAPIKAFNAFFCV